VRWVDEQQLRAMMADDSLVFTPWFKLICESYLFGWWKDLAGVGEHRSDEIDCLL
jgi:isopentenyl-diphosphate delta-isomerase